MVIKSLLPYPLCFWSSSISEMEELKENIQRSLQNPAKSCGLVLGVLATEPSNFSDQDSWLKHVFLTV